MVARVAAAKGPKRRSMTHLRATFTSDVVHGVELLDSAIHCLVEIAWFADVAGEDQYPPAIRGDLWQPRRACAADDP